MSNKLRVPSILTNCFGLRYWVAGIVLCSLFVIVGCDNNNQPSAVSPTKTLANQQASIATPDGGRAMTPTPGQITSIDHTNTKITVQDVLNNAWGAPDPIYLGKPLPSGVNTLVIAMKDGSGTFKLWYEVPNRWRIEDSTGIKVFNGDLKADTSSSLSYLRMPLGLFVPGEFTPGACFEIGKATLLGSSTFLGHPAWVINVPPKAQANGQDCGTGAGRIWIDQQTYLTLRTAFIVNNKEFVVEVTELSYNQPIDPALFNPLPTATPLWDASTN